jgi:tetratricopeptide (TPR) repeat protein
VGVRKSAGLGYHALAIDRFYNTARIGKGRALLEQERVADALNCFDAALAIDPES